MHEESVPFIVNSGSLIKLDHLNFVLPSMTLDKLLTSLLQQMKNLLPRTTMSISLTRNLQYK
jgi:hypothetical protein